MRRVLSSGGGTEGKPSVTRYALFARMERMISVLIII